MNQNTYIIDCQGTCKTPIGCTCGRKKKVTNGDIELDGTAKTVTKSCGCSSGGGGCSSGGGCACKSGGGCSSKGGGCCSGTNKLEVYNWLEDIPGVEGKSQMVEVQFKNTRKGYYLNSNDIEVYKGDIVAVEATPGHDIGEVTLTGKLVELQMLKNNYRGETKRIYRLAKPNDIEKWEEAKAKEHKTMLRAREIAEELQLNMKISDVEFQGDGNKSIFYYIADERVDFRQLIKVYASEFRVKIEMKQIGARQEAGRVGGIGPCGRELCCSSSMSNFVSVSTSAARLQDIPLNPQKLAGQCGKLKCCLNFEVDTYVEAQRKLPSKDAVLETKDGSYFHFKTDILSGEMIYSTDKHFAANLITLPKERVFEVIKINKQGSKPTHLKNDEQEEKEKPVSQDILQENITRFDSSDGRNKKKKFQKAGNNENASVNNSNGEQRQRPNQEGRPQHPKNNKQANNRPEGNKPENNRRDNNRPDKNRPEGNRQEGGRPEIRKADNNNRPDNSKPEGNKAEGNKPENGQNQQTRNNNRRNKNRNRPNSENGGSSEHKSPEA